MIDVLLKYLGNGDMSVAWICWRNFI